jgi:DNA repair exonuclease SbcCD nuclease subunit
LHTADWQIGMKAAHVGDAGPRVREERIAAARRVVEAARAHRVEFIVIAGDTFEDNGVDRVLVQTIADVLASFGGPVFITPGNHDPLTPGSVWEHPAWRAAPGVRVLGDETPVEVPGGTLFPCPAREKHSDRDPTAWINAHDARGIRVGLAHGAVEGRQQEDAGFPVARDAVARAGLDYLALGHWHSTALYPARDGAVRMAYAGTHEPTKFGERDSGNALLVEIAAPGAPPLVTPVRTGGLTWLALDAEVREPGDLARLRERIASLESPATTLLRLRLTGLLPASEQNELVHLTELVAARFLYGRTERHGLRPSPTDPAWLARLPPGVVRDAAVRLQALSDPGFQGPRPPGATADVAAWALLELFEMAEEAT